MEGEFHVDPHYYQEYSLKQSTESNWTGKGQFSFQSQRKAMPKNSITINTKTYHEDKRISYLFNAQVFIDLQVRV